MKLRRDKVAANSPQNQLLPPGGRARHWHIPAGGRCQPPGLTESGVSGKGLPLPQFPHQHKITCFLQASRIGGMGGTRNCDHSTRPSKTTTCCIHQCCCWFQGGETNGLPQGHRGPPAALDGTVWRVSSRPTWPSLPAAWNPPKGPYCARPLLDSSAKVSKHTVGIQNK